MSLTNTNSKVLVPIVYGYMLFGFISLFFLPFNWLHALAFFLFVALGNGTVGHRYFSHNSFAVAKPVHWLLGLWCTLTAYSPVAYWIVQHRHHHRNSDSPKDIHSPKNGMLKAFIFWSLDKKRVDSIFHDRASMVNYVHAMKDPAVKFFSDHHFLINTIFHVLLAVVDYHLLFAFFAAYMLEQFRLGIINTVNHIPGMPFNYRNHDDVKDRSQNNLLTGLLFLGFGWHNNHHKDAKKLILTERWWEIDIEGYVGWLLGLTGKWNKSTKA